MPDDPLADYLNAERTAELWGVIARSVRAHCSAGRVPGAIKVAGAWFIPLNAEKPQDLRDCVPARLAKQKSKRQAAPK